MACNASQLLADGIAFQDLAGLELKAVILQLAAEWLLLLDPDAEVTAEDVLARAQSNGMCCDDRNVVRAAILQTLCTIVTNPPNPPPGDTCFLLWAAGDNIMDWSAGGQHIKWTDCPD